MASGPITSWQIDGETVETMADFILGAPKSLQMVTATMKSEGEGKGEVAQSCPTLCDPMDCSLPGSSVHGILQARILEWVVQCMKVKSESEVVQSCVTLCYPMDCSLPGSSVHEILQARVPEWVAISFPRGSS